MSEIFPFFQITLPNGDICKFGKGGLEPRIIENRFVYTYTISDAATQTRYENDAVRYEVTLTENTIGAVLQELNLHLARHHITFWWHVPPSVQWDMEDEGWTVEQLMNTTIGDHLDLRIIIEATLVDTYVTPLLLQENDDIVDEYQMPPGPWLHGSPQQSFLDEIAAWRARQALEIPDPTLPPLYDPNTHSETGTPFARPWDAQDEAELLARQAEDAVRISGIIIDKATELSTQVAVSVLN
jgi:hypothetical protein